VIYLDSGATTLQKPPQVARAMAWAANHCASPGRGGYQAAATAERLAFSTRELACALFGVPSPEQVVFTSSATHGLNIAIRSLVSPGDKVMISGYEHNAVTRTLASIPDVTVTVVRGTLFQPEEFLRQMEEQLDDSYGAVILCYVSNVFGYVLPVAEAARICREKGVPLIVDAAQGAGIYPINLEDWGASFVAMPGHKGLYGPQGTGLLLCGTGQVRPLLTGGTGSQSSQAEMPQFLPDRLEPGTHNMPGIAGLYQGLCFLRRRGMDRIRNWEEMLKDRMVGRLSALPGVEVFAGVPQAGVISFRAEGVDCEVLAAQLARRGVAVRSGLHCAPLAHETVGTLESGTTRISFSAFNTPREVELAADILAQILREEKEKKSSISSCTAGQDKL
jgi:selenocysteine lyase/cysteine desulfurase